MAKVPMRERYEAFSSVQRQPGADEHRWLLVKWLPTPGDPGPLYRSAGLEPTAKVDDKIVGRAVLEAIS
jgi:hypothetical protein